MTFTSEYRFTLSTRDTKHIAVVFFSDISKLHALFSFLVEKQYVCHGLEVHMSMNTYDVRPILGALNTMLPKALIDQLNKKNFFLKFTFFVCHEVLKKLICKINYINHFLLQYHA